MGRSGKILCLLLFCFTLCGCQSNGPQVPRLVTQIQIVGVHQNIPVEVIYTNPQKMETILYYLRSLEDLGRADTDPERIMGDRFKITVSFTDGSKSVYRQQADRFLSRDGRPWQAVDPQKARMLYPLMAALPADHFSDTKAA